LSQKIVFAIDQNLGLAIEDPPWRRWLQKYSIVPSLYTDMKQLTEDMEKNKILLSYLPTANFFYFRNDSFYTPIANALFSATNTTKINALVIVSKKSSIDTLDQLEGKTYGYIHPYCTSSYFSIALHLWRNHFSFPHFFSSIKEVGPWQAQIEAVISGEVDATTVPEDVWHKIPRNGEKTKVIAIVPNLPSPLIIVGQGIDKTLLSELKELLFSYKPSGGMFNGFVPFQKEQTEKFFAEASQALRII